ncbi:MAG: hypothetical protein IT184_15795 [Acidobacteria bacterium]|nr:hypothetical protein [Acidobacteriota bacterium]
MIHVLVTPQFDRPIRNLTANCGGALDDTIRIVTYPYILTRRQVDPGTYLFADLDRVPGADAAAVRDLAAALSATGAARVLNDPRRVLLRYDLLRLLHDRGVNDFRVFRASDDLGGVRFPVFVRCEHDHGGPRTPLISNPSDLASAIDRLGRRRSWREQLIVTECVATPDGDGLYRKYGALFVRGRIIPSHLIVARSWLVKGHYRVVTADIATEEYEYVRDNPHAARLAPLFELAGIDYGRIDYGFADGRLQVYEINTNPTVMGRRQAPHASRRPKRQILVDRLVDAFRALDADGPRAKAGETIALRPRRGLLPSWAFRSVRATQGLWKMYAHRSGIRAAGSASPSHDLPSAPRARADGPHDALAPPDEVEHANERRGVHGTEIRPQP